MSPLTSFLLTVACALFVWEFYLIIEQVKRWVEAKADCAEMSAWAFDRDAHLDYYEDGSSK